MSIKRIFFAVVGLISLLLGVIGIVIPILPTVPFILLSAYCFARSSQRLHQWLLTHPWFADGLNDWQKHKAMKASLKRRAFWITLASFSISIIIVPLIWVKILLAVMAVVLLSYMSTIPVIND